MEEKNNVAGEQEKSAKKLRSVSPTPHIRDKATTRGIMGMVVLALMPAALYGIWHFGPKALLLLVLSIAACVGSEWGFEKLTKQKNTAGDLSAVVTGLLLGMNLPVAVPWWMPVLGGCFAIIVVKMLFGGLGQNFMNPALGARCFLVLSFSKYMTDFSYRPGWGGADVVSGATPLAAAKNGEAYDLMQMFLGNEGGTIGETSALALLIGGIFLLLSGVITWHVSVCYIASLLAFVLLFSGHGADLSCLGAQLCGGGLMLGAFFMATDYVTRPITRKGQVIYGIFLGVLTGIFRVFAPGAEGVSYAIIIGNLLVPLIERVTLPKHFGYRKQQKA
ncbi:MAG: RnfABCDGE type electron transport complex subunit D [Lachnospiraceae bacterium]|nr:RnfABCDGE type electron transport complex subunit D [Lachnospiraceae bacterium]